MGVDPTEVFVGREEILEELASSLPSEAVVVGDAFGIFGSGKSALLRRLAEIVPARGAGQCMVVTDDAGLFDLPRGGNPATLEAPLRTYRAFTDWLEKTAAGLQKYGPRSSYETFKHALSAARRDHLRVHISQSLNAGPVTGNLSAQNVRLDMEHARAVLEFSQSALAESFAAMVNEFTSSRRFVWMVDAYDAMADHEMGRWFASLIGTLQNTLVVLARRPLGEEPKLPGKLLRRGLRRLTIGEVRAFVSQCLPASSETLVASIFEFSSGHPLTVAMAIELYQRVPSSDRGVEAFARLLRALPADASEKHAKMAREIVRTGGSQGVERVLEACAIARSFDANVLPTLIGGDSPTSPATLIDTFKAHTFIEMSDAGPPPTYRVYGFIANGLEHSLLNDDPARYRELHKRAADYHHAWLNEYDEAQREKGGSTYYRYDDPLWRVHERSLLYHQSSITRAQTEGPDKDAARRRERLRFVRIFMDAFWWWGCYLSFPYCDELIGDWERAGGDRVRELRTVVEHYPQGPEKQRSGDQWGLVEDALLSLVDSCRLEEQGDDSDEEERRHTLAIVNNFLAHCRRHQIAARGDQQRQELYAAARSRYDTAERLLEEDADHYDLAWTLFERAELHHDFGHPNEAERDWRMSSAILLDPEKEVEDEELTANLHRLKADMRWSSNRMAAFDSYGRAVAHAYLFQDRPHPPDAYTAMFYREMVGRAIDRIRETARDPGLEAAVVALRAPLGEGALGPEKLAEVASSSDGALSLIFPAGPKDEELMSDDSEFLRRWRARVRGLGKHLENDLGGVT